MDIRKMCKIKVMLSCFIDSLILVIYAFFIVYDVLSVSKISFGVSERILLILKNTMLWMALFKIVLFWNQNNKKRIWAIAFLGLAVILKAHVALDYWQLVIIVVSMANIDFDKIVKVNACSLSVTLLSILICALTGIIADGFINTNNSRKISRMYDLGMKHHSWFMIYWLFLVMGVIYLARKSKHILAIILGLEIVSLVLWMHTASNTPTISIVILCSLLQMLYFFERYEISVKPCFYKIGAILSLMMPVISVFLTILGVCLFGKMGYVYLPQTMMSRFRNIKHALDLYGVKLPFEQMVEPYDDVYFNLFLGVQGNREHIGHEMDNLYGRLFIFAGGIVFLLYVFMQIYVRYKAYKNKNTVLMVILFVICIFNISEARAFTSVGGSLFTLLLFANEPRNIDYQEK